MRHCVLSALIGAALADHSAKRTNLCSVNASTGHSGCRKSAQFGAFDVIRYAFRHHLNVIFFKA